jgi:hypothetical protein
MFGLDELTYYLAEVEGFAAVPADSKLVPELVYVNIYEAHESIPSPMFDN